MTIPQRQKKKIAVVIPCYKVSRHIQSVISEIPERVNSIYVIDDFCPEETGKLVQSKQLDIRVKVITLAENQGVGGATILGISHAISDGADIIVKIDGDGQMDSSLIPMFIEPILNHEADYTKGNRFYELEKLSRMPIIRLIGNTGLSFLCKVSTGYWDIFDPTNGFFAINAQVASVIPWHKISKRFFFESDLLFRLSMIRAKVIDIPIYPIYRNEISNLNPWKEVPIFFIGHLKNFIKRIIYTYFVRDFNIASVELLLGILLLLFGFFYGISNWKFSAPAATAGTVMLSALPLLIGFQCLLSFLNYDTQSMPKISLQKRGYHLKSIEYLRKK
ncbi:MAG: glycosyltransferase family 2 protein [Aphanizomenon gracile PMC627.10]|nr:glycosyltransferase family 2 protein [Aphanizomenon gracile PMC627.10]